MVGYVLEYIDHIEEEEAKRQVFEFLMTYLIRNENREDAMRYMAHVFMMEQNDNKRNEGIAYLITVASHHEDDHQRAIAVSALMTALHGGRSEE